jgi:PAS domain S-box-containing protein
MDFFDSGRREGGPALSRLLAEAAMVRAALGACPCPIAILDAGSPSRPVTYVNAAFEEAFGVRAADALGRALGALVFRGDEALVHRMLAESAFSKPVRAWSKDGSPRPVELALGALRDRDGRVTHWVASFADRSEAEQLHAQLESMRDAMRGPAAKAA